MATVSRREGLTEEKLAHLSEYESSDLFDEIDRLVLRYATAMTNTPVKVEDELFNGLKKHFDEKQLIELTATIAHENLRARMDHAFGIESGGFSNG